MCPLTYCSYGEARETSHGCSAVHFTEEVSRHFVCENPPPPPAKNLTRNELRLLELSGLSWSERQPTPHGSYSLGETAAKHKMEVKVVSLGSTRVIRVDATLEVSVERS